jgi:hypothetical protein
MVVCLQAAFVPGAGTLGVCCACAKGRRRVENIEAIPSLSGVYTDPRTQCEQSSIIFEHCSTLSEFRSISVDHVTIAKPSGLGMVSSFKASAARMIFWLFPQNDARRIWLL